jgi:hypothetical protein
MGVFSGASGETSVREAPSAEGTCCDVAKYVSIFMARRRMTTLLAIFEIATEDG